MNETIEKMTDLFDVEIFPDEGRVTVHLKADAPDNSSFAASIARKMLGANDYQRGGGGRNRAFEALAHQIGQGAKVCAGVAKNGQQVGSERAAETFPALENKVYFGDEETEAVPQEDAVVLETVVATD